MKLDLFLLPNHCRIEQNNLRVRSNSRTIHNGNNWVWQHSTLQMLMNSSSLKYRPLSSLEPQLGSAFSAPWVLGAVSIPPSHHGGCRNHLAPSWPGPIVGGLWQTVSSMSGLYSLSAPKKPDWEHLNRKCNFRGNSRGSGYRKACSGRVGTNHGVMGCWGRLGHSLSSGSPAWGRGWHCAARLWNQKAVMEVE